MWDQKIGFVGGVSVDAACVGHTTEGVEVAVFMYELKQNEFKVSLRSKEKIDVSKIAQYFGGGGHKKASGFTMAGTPFDVLNNLSKQIEAQMEKLEKTQEQ